MGDPWQAEALALTLLEEGVAGDVTAEPVADADILDVERPWPRAEDGRAKAAGTGKRFGPQEAERPTAMGCGSGARARVRGRRMRRCCCGGGPTVDDAEARP